VLPIYFINLATRPDRRAFMEAQLSSLGLAGIRIEAVTPADLSVEETAAYCDAGKPFHFRPRELSCTKSHERAWETFVAAGHDRAVILEDDAQLSSRLPNFLKDIADVDFDLIRIEETGRRLRVFPKVATTASGIELRPFRSTPMGASGYIRKASAARLLLGHPGMRERQTDLAIYSPFKQPGASLGRVQTFPGLCRQLGHRTWDSQSVGRSDIDLVHEPHSVSSRLSLRSRAIRAWRNLQDGWLNAKDHIAVKKNGLVRLEAPFSDDR
jgi:glycosyl transferase, family 25